MLAPPLYGLPSLTPFSQENVDPPSYNYSKIPTPHKNGGGGGGGGGGEGGGRGGLHHKVSLQLLFPLPEKVCFFPNNARMYEIDHCARWELVFTFYSMIFIDLSYCIHAIVSFCSKERLGFGEGRGVR